MSYIKCLILFIAVLCLAGCSQERQYKNLLLHPQKLKQAVEQCQQLGEKAQTTQKCIDAKFAVRVATIFSQLEEQYGQQFAQARYNFQQLRNEWYQNRNKPGLQEQLVIQKQKVLQADYKMSLGMQATVSKKIISSEIVLSGLEQKLVEAKEHKADSDVITQLKKKSSEQHQKINVLYVLLKVFFPEN